MAYIGTFIKINKRYLIIFLLAVLNLFFIYFFFDFPKINADTPGYIEAIVHFREKPQQFAKTIVEVNWCRARVRPNQQHRYEASVYAPSPL